jgi:hypothetical protein
MWIPARRKEAIMATDAKRSDQEVPDTGRGPAAPVSRLRREGPPRSAPDLAMLHRKARVALAETLEPGEQPLLLIPGLASSAIVATARRAFVFKTGAKAGLPFGARLKAFEYESVMRADLRPAGDVDVVVIHAPLKISTCSSYWADARDDPWKARNAIAVTRGSQTAKRSVEELSTLVHEFNDRGISRPSESGPKAPTGDRTPDVVGRIAELERPVTDVCPRCGNELGAAWQFCPRCGAPADAGRRGRAAQRRHRS